MKDLNPTDGDTNQATSDQSPDFQKRLDEFNQRIGNALCENLNRGVLPQRQSKLKLATGAGRSADLTVEDAVIERHHRFRSACGNGNPSSYEPGGREFKSLRAHHHFF
jgi:hypothetical protein